MTDSLDSRLGMDRGVTRRDFLNATTLGAGAGLLAMAAPLAGCRPNPPRGSQAGGPLSAVGPEWYGPGGMGDYADSHGNTPDVVNGAHALRDGRFGAAGGQAVHDTGESYDVVIVGGGIAGLGAAFELNRDLRGRRYLLIDNHPVFGGESKRNELVVDGVRLIGPQGANGFSTPTASVEAKYAEGDAKYYEELGIPREFRYSPPENTTKPLRFGRDNYGFLYWLEHQVSVGHFFRGEGRDPIVAVDPFRNGFGPAPLPPDLIRSLTEFVAGRPAPRSEPDLDRWLDGQSYAEFIEQVFGLPRAVTDYLDPIVASAVGLGCDATSAYAAYADVLPGFQGHYPENLVDHRHSFPGGNDGFARHFVKAIMPWAIEGDDGFEAILNGRIRFQELDLSGRPARMRLGATVVSVCHDGPPEQAATVSVVYLRNGELFRVRAKGGVMASGGWVNRYVVRDLRPRTGPPAPRSFTPRFWWPTSLSGTGASSIG